MEDDSVVYECKSRSGLVDLSSFKGDESTFDIILIASLSELDPCSDSLQDCVVNKFMTLVHNTVVKSKHFNWN